MALQLPLNFQNDIKGNATNIVPLVHIGNQNDFNDESDIGIRLSTAPLTYYNSPKTITFHALPLLLNIPSIKESVDLKNRKYKINSVRLDISNYSYNGIKFSDIIPENIINMECRIYLTSPTTHRAYWEGGSDKQDTDFAQIYNGIIKNHTISESKISITLEDRTELALHQDLPVQNDTNWLPNDSTIPEKYRGKPKPIAYGRVDKSPCVIGNNGKIIIDTKNIQRLVSNTNPIFSKSYNSLCIGDNGKFITVVPTFEEDLGSTVSVEVQGEENIIILDKIGQNQWTHSQDSSNNIADPYIQLATNNLSISNNVLQCRVFHKPSSVELVKRTGEDEFSEVNILTEDDLLTLSNNDYSDNVELDTALTLFNTGSVTSGDVYRKIFYRMNISTSISVSDSIESRTRNVAINSILLPKCSVEEGAAVDMHRIYAYPMDARSYNESLVIGTTGNLTHSLYNEADSGAVKFDLRELFGFPDFDGNGVSGNIYNYDDGGSSKFIDIYFETNNQEDFVSLPMSSSGGRMIPAIFFYDLCGINDFLVNEGLYRIDFRVHSQTSDDDIDGSTDFLMASGLGSCQQNYSGKLHEFDVETLVDVENIYNKSYYANIYGRIDNDNNVIQSPKAIVIDILRDLTGNETFTPSGVNTYSTNYSGFFNAFTVDKKIESKKLIENVLSTSPFIGRFSSNGEFKFYEIPSSGYKGEQGTTIDKLIDSSDVIDFKFSRTKDIYTKILLKYKLNYNSNDFEEQVEVTAQELFSEYNNSYYGLNNDHSESTLVLDGEHGKYIRNELAAKNFAYWLLSFNANAHLKIIVDLPLRYIDLEVGDIIQFNSLIKQDLLPYGINYKSTTGSVNGQPIFATFIVTSTNKSIDKLTIECIQNHALITTPCDGTLDCTGTYCGDPGDGQFAEIDACGVCNGNSVSGEDCCPGSCSGTVEGYDSLNSRELCVSYGTCWYFTSDCGGTSGLPCPPDLPPPYGGMTKYYKPESGTASLDNVAHMTEAMCTNIGNTEKYYDDQPGFTNYSGETLPGKYNYGHGSTFVPLTWNEGYLDCTNTCNGNTLVDDCGNCDGDCFESDGFIGSDCKECGCTDIPEGDCDCNGNTLDCDGVCGGTKIINECGDCAEPTDECNIDCNGDLGGDASTQLCSICLPEGGDVDKCYSEIGLKLDRTADVMPILIIKKLKIIFKQGFDISKTGINFSVSNDELYTQPPSNLNWQTDDTYNPDGSEFWGGYEINLEDLIPGLKIYKDGNTLITLNEDDNGRASILFECEEPIVVGFSTQFEMFIRISNTEFDALDYPVEDIQIWHKQNEDNIIELHNSSEMIDYTIINGDRPVSYSDNPNTTVPSQKLSILMPDSYYPDSSILPYSKGDLNQDGQYNVLDVVQLANCVLAGTCESDLINPASGDMNDDGLYNVLDIVTLANCVLNNNCEAID